MQKWYAQRLIAEFHRETYYRVAPENDEDMLKYIAEKVLPFKDMVTFVRQGTAISQAMCYGSLKYHKDPPTLRPIIGSFAAPTKKLSLAITYILSGIMPNIEQAWIDLYKTAGITTTRSWIVKDTAEISTFAKELNTNILRKKRRHIDLNTFDFSSLYTEIKHDDLADRMDFVIDLAFGDFTHLELKAGKKVELKKNPDPAPRVGPKIRHIPKTMLKDAVRTLIGLTYFKLGIRILQQIIGIPMGTNCAVFIANLFLFSYEYEFIKHCIDSGRIDIIKQLRYTRRYIDDLLSANCLHFLDYATNPNNVVHKAIYPFYIKLNREQGPSLAVSMLDIFLFYDKKTKCIETTIYSKQNDPKYAKLAFIKYPHITSILMNRCKYGCIRSQVIRFARRCSQRKGFLDNTARLIVHLHTKRGYILRRLFKYLNNALRRLIPHPEYNFTTMTQASNAISNICKRLLAVAQIDSS